MSREHNSYLPESELPACFLLPSAFLLLNVDFCCLAELGIVVLGVLASLLGLPFITVAAMLDEVFPSSPTTDRELVVVGMFLS